MCVCVCVCVCMCMCMYYWLQHDSRYKMAWLSFTLKQPWKTLRLVYLNFSSCDDELEWDCTTRITRPYFIASKPDSNSTLCSPFRPFLNWINYVSLQENFSVYLYNEKHMRINTSQRHKISWKNSYCYCLQYELVCIFRSVKRNYVYLCFMCLISFTNF
jgi:hypothetical protein